MSDWQLLTLEGAGIRLLDCVHKTPPAVESGFPYVAIPQMRNGEIDFTTARLISKKHLAEWTQKTKPRLYDVVLSRRCNPGETAYVRSEIEFALGQNLVLLRADGKRVRPRFLRWLVKSQYWWDQIEKFRNVGAVFDSLRCADIPKFELPVPPLDDQDAIISVLGPLDDKIELNERMNETLEAMARAIFKDWFIDFGPTRAKMGGRTPYLASDIWRLFPDALDSERPEGWEVSTIGREVDVVGGSTPSTKEHAFWDGTINWATPKDLSTLSSPVLLETARKISEMGLSEISSGLLPAGTVLLSSRAPIGYLAIAEVPVAINQGFIAMQCNRRLSNVHVWLWTVASMEAILQHANGSTFQEISKQNFRPLSIVVPPAPVRTAFDELAQPLYERIAANERESRTLAHTRDLLLPKLMSGEIRLSEAEKTVEATA